MTNRKPVELAEYADGRRRGTPCRQLAFTCRTLRPKYLRNVRVSHLDRSPPVLESSQQQMCGIKPGDLRLFRAAGGWPCSGWWWGAVDIRGWMSAGG